MALTELKKPETSAPDFDTAEKDPTIGRRRFLRWGIYAVGAGVAGVLAVPVVGTFIAPALRSDTKEVRASLGTIADLAKNLDVPVAVTLSGVKYTDVFKPATIDDKDVYVRAIKAGASTKDDFIVLDSTCTHAGCTVPFNDNLKIFKCPCHGAEYNLDGINQKVAPKPLGRYDLQVNDKGELTINVFQKFV